jgi:hypothetical protein
MKIAGWLAAASVAAWVSSGPAAAHHAFSTEFDANQPITLKGTITRVEWINPHAWIHLDVPRDGGVVEKWRIEAGSPNTLVRRGMTRVRLPPPQRLERRQRPRRDAARRPPALHHVAGHRSAGRHGVAGTDPTCRSAQRAFVLS